MQALAASTSMCACDAAGWASPDNSHGLTPHMRAGLHRCQQLSHVRTSASTEPGSQVRSQEGCLQVQPLPS